MHSGFSPTVKATETLQCSGNLGSIVSRQAHINRNKLKLDQLEHSFFKIHNKCLN